MCSDVDSFDRCRYCAEQAAGDSLAKPGDAHDSPVVDCIRIDVEQVSMPAVKRLHDCANYIGFGRGREVRNRLDQVTHRT
jgi:hypothetical protein